MVAYTSPDCLPYFECADSPCLNTGTLCDPSTVWCDMTGLLENIMNGFDDVVSRTAEQVPFFKLARSTEQLVDQSDFGEEFALLIEWDTVLADNDNMVNLDADNRGAFINRSGLWQFELYVVGHPPQTVNNVLSSNIRMNNDARAFGTGVWRTANEAYLRAGVIMSLPQSTLNSNGTTLINCRAEFSGAAAPDDIVHVLYAELTGFWIGEA